MLEQAGMEIQGRKVILLGNGGAAQAVQAVLEDLGAAAIVKVKRNPSPETLTYEEAYRDHSGAQVIVNTSPVGMFPAQEGIPVELDRFPQLESVADVIYNPHRTRLIVEAQKRGCRTATGLSMLTAQAAEAIEAFIGKPVAPGIHSAHDGRTGAGENESRLNRDAGLRQKHDRQETGGNQRPSGR